MPPASIQLVEPLLAPFGCQACRDQHLGCDRVLPACGRCVSTHKQCTRGFKFRVRSGPFTRRQQWVRIPRRLEFVRDGVTGDAEFYSDEDNYYNGDVDASSAAPPAQPTAQNPTPQTGQRSPESSGEASNSHVLHPIATSSNSSAPAQAPALPRAGGQKPPVRKYGSKGKQPEAPQTPVVHTGERRQSLRLAEAASQQTQQPSPQSPRSHGHGGLEGQRPLPHPPYQHHQRSMSENSPLSPTDRFIVQEDFAPAVHPPLVLGPEDRAAHPRIYTDRSIFPLDDRRQAFLLRHFVQKLAIWLDLCEPSHQFGTIVPQRAANCTVLMNAILALSSKHLAHLGNFDRYASDHYHQECLNLLIPMLSHEDTAGDENLFAATIILRVWEEMEFKHTGFDSQGYLLGIHAFVHGHGHKIVPNTLSAAAFWVGLRQEIYTATVNQQPVKAPLVPSIADGARNLGPAADHDWANRAVIHCVDVLNFCFGDNTPSLSPRFSWDELNAWNKQWTARLPSSFTPTFLKERGPDDAFPEIWHHSTWHVTGIQHHLLAELFLVSFDPRIPRIGRQRLEAARLVNDRVCELVREVCGIGLGNQWTPPAMFTASMAITAFGDRFQERRDQEALLDLLRRTDRDHARPTEAVQQQLMRSWGWQSSQMTDSTANSATRR